MIGFLARSVVVILAMQFGAALLDLNHLAVFLSSLVACGLVEAVAFGVHRSGGKR